MTALPRLRTWPTPAPTARHRAGRVTARACTAERILTALMVGGLLALLVVVGLAL